MFGDSWAAGAELSDDEKPFGKILAESNNLIYKDYSLGGCSNPKMLLQLNDAIEKNDGTVSISLRKFNNDIKIRIQDLSLIHI